VTLEARWLRVMNRMGLGARLKTLDTLPGAAWQRRTNCWCCRWHKCKLGGAQIDKLTATAGTDADDALKRLEASVAGLRFFAWGKRGVLYAGELKSNEWRAGGGQTGRGRGVR
jgi:hypothetical protein